MKENSDNFRESAVLDIVEILKNTKIKIYIYEPLIDEKYFNGIEVISDLNNFINKSDLIVANRISGELDSVKNKVYSRDIFKEN